jgi:gamma-glutamyl hydrolase
MVGIRGIRHKTTKSRQSCVGIITMPHKMSVKYGTSHVMKTYVDWFEDRGVRVIPIPYDTTEYESYFNNINGIIFPGGETKYVMDDPHYFKCCQAFFSLAIQANLLGDYFPIWGVCCGFQMLLFLIGKFYSLKKYPSHGLTLIHITKAGKKSRMLHGFTDKYLEYLEKYPSCRNNHEYGISPEDFNANKNLKRFYKIVGTSIAENDKEYVAAIEARDFPFYGVQWHPERQVTTEPFADFIVSEIRKNNHRIARIPRSIRDYTKAKKCSQYPHFKNEMCYFF